MKVSSSKENILKKIRKALSESTPLPFPQSEGNSSVYQPAQDDIEVLFAQNFTQLLGKFIFCINQQELAAALQNITATNKWQHVYCVENNLQQTLLNIGYTNLNTSSLKDCDVSITTCECLVARTGTIVMSSAQQSGRTTSVYAPVHICIATTKQLVYDVKEALLLMKEKYPGNMPSFTTFASGPSRTADIEKTLVVGIHGPKEVYVLLVEEG
jgi:L-lactate dehydrogenase complex protein LldG